MHFFFTFSEFSTSCVFHILLIYHTSKLNENSIVKSLYVKENQVKYYIKMLNATLRRNEKSKNLTKEY